MSGVLDDGVLGLGAIRSRGGITIGHSLDDALFPALPAKAADAGVLDEQAAAAGIGKALKQLSQRDIKEPDMESDARMELENLIAMAPRFSTSFDIQEVGPEHRDTAARAATAHCFRSARVTFAAVSVMRGRLTHTWPLAIMRSRGPRA